MKKIISVAVMTLATATMTVPAHAHAHNDSNFGDGANAANLWNFTADVVCLQEVAVVPVLGDWVGGHANNCSNGNVIDHSGR
ncbi:hypothetical protein [Kitasatospora purpeofusca]|uniref:hypothetical protein n=1 Tax=Kitasatospora purpeofusca TaxID=67352 RepID=UPI002A5AE17E|nr:hypothetical protein [Kitasatospora purpeofusca]MDY0811085.1 hypothetical protein [Kitasatospora purpeofusca]